MKRILPILLVFCAVLFVVSSCKKEVVVQPPTPCVEKTWYEDADGDGLGNPDVTISHCDQPAGYVLDNTDVLDMPVQQKQIPILIKFTGETCPPCGGWGWVAWDGLSNKFVGKGLSWSNYGDGFSDNHFRSQELNPTMDLIENRFFKSGGKPTFCANGIDFAQSDAAAETEANNSLALVPDVAAVMNSKIEGDQLTVNASVKFFNDLSTGVYYVGVYLIEDKPVHYQAGHADGNNAKHHLVMRGSLTSSAWGEKLVDNGAKAGDVFNKSYTVTIPSTYNKDHFSYGVVIWKKFGAIYLYENAYSTQ